MTSRTAGIAADEVSPLTLGCAALGQAYGIANPAAPMSEGEARALLDRCWGEGIRTLDTAAAYGSAEERIGAWLSGSGKRPVIVSKTPPLTSVSDDEVAGVLTRYLADSLDRLRLPQIDGFLLHSACDWRRAPVRSALRKEQAAGRVRSVGISGYDPAEVLELMAVEPMEIVQIPLSIFDQRAVESGLLDRAAESGTLVFARSVFLQGILFMDPERLPPFFEAMSPVLAELRGLAAEADCPLSALALGAVLGAPGVSSAIIGLYSPDQAAEAAAAAAAPIDRAILRAAAAIASRIPPEIRDPRQWPPRGAQAGAP